MRILIEIGHPAHVHFFKRPIERLKERGHSVLVITRNKDITNALLKKFGIPFKCLSRPYSWRSALFLELGWRWLATFFLLIRYRINRSVSISGITTSLPSRLCGVANLVFTDTEDAKISNWIAFPFATRVLTPDFYLGNLGPKQVRYAGLHELAYLQTFDFEQSARRRKSLGMPERYFVIRMVKNDALHDWDIQGLRVAVVEKLVRRLHPFGQVFITCEGAIDRRLEAFRLGTPLTDIHNILAGALLFIGESPTMAVESSLLGTPAFLVSQRAARLGNMIGLENQHGLLRNFNSDRDLETAIAGVTDFVQMKTDWQLRAEQFRNGSCAMETMIVDAVVGVPIGMPGGLASGSSGALFSPEASQVAGGQPPCAA